MDYMSNENIKYIEYMIKGFIYIKQKDINIHTLKLIKVPFKFDTGADICNISPTYLDILGYTEDWCKRNAELVSLKTASDDLPKMTYKFKLPLTNFCGFEMRNLEVVRGLSNVSLLGLNLINIFDWNISYANKEIKFRLREEVVDNLKNSEFEIHYVGDNNTPNVATIKAITW